MSDPIPVIICDDSSLARRQMARCLQGWNVEITQAEHGLEAMEAIRAGKGDLLFLDLNMPIMDGYQVLERIQRDDLPTMVLVVSGDIQPDAQKRVKAAGALDFIKKPIDRGVISQILHQYGLLQELNTQPLNKPANPSGNIDSYSFYREIANIAMGQAADRLARLLQVFVHLPVPQVSLRSPEQLNTTITQHNEQDNGVIISQGFVGAGIAGEALLMFDAANISDMARLLGYEQTPDAQTEKEVVIELANVLSGAFLNSLAHLLDISFSQSPPFIMGIHGKFPDLNTATTDWQQVLSIDIRYQITSHQISCDLLVLFSEQSLDALNQRARFFS